MQPAAEREVGHPAAPADLKPLIEIELIDREPDREESDDGEEERQLEEVVPVLVLQRVVEAVSPGVEHHIDRDLRQLEHDDGGKQAASGQFVLGAEIGDGEPPYDGERRA